jgi:TctA family transporter
LWIRLLSVPYNLLYPAILMFCCIGAFSMNNNTFDIYMTIPFAILGYLFIKLECEPAPLLLGFVLGKLMEEYLRRAMTISRGDATVFVTRPLSATLLAIAAILLIIVFLPAIRKKREEAFAEED